MFMNTIAVGPLEVVASCAAAGTGVASVRIWLATFLCHNDVLGVLESFARVLDGLARFVSCPKGARNAILNG